MKRDKRLLILFITITLVSGILGYLLDQVLTDQPEGNSCGVRYCNGSRQKETFAICQKNHEKQDFVALS